MLDFTRKEKNLAYLLRHDYKNYPFDIHAWREVRDLVENHGYTLEELDYIVAHSEKKRFSFSDDKLWVRALYGHSFEVDLELEPTMPPEFLLHGTVADKVPSIMEKGLLRMKRCYVHLSVNENIAKEVGTRKRNGGAVVVLKIDARRLWNAGELFWHFQNDIWLTKFVPPEYISVQQ